MIREILLDDDGEVLAATCVDQPLSDEARRALTALAHAAREHMATLPDEVWERQEASRQRIRARNARLHGEVLNGPEGEANG